VPSVENTSWFDEEELDLGEERKLLLKVDGL